MRLPDKYRYPVELEGEDLNLFLSYEMDEIKKSISEIDSRLIKLTQRRLTASQVEPAHDKGKGWYRFNLSYATERGLIPITALRQALNKKQQHFAFFDAGLVNLQDPQFDWIRRLNKDRFEKKSDGILLSSLEFMRLNAFDPIQILEKERKVPDQSREYFDALNHLQTPDEPNIEGLNSHLRPYQRKGRLMEEVIGVDDQMH